MAWHPAARSDTRRAQEEAAAADASRRAAEALASLEGMLEGGVFDPRTISTWIGPEAASNQPRAKQTWLAIARGAAETLHVRGTTVTAAMSATLPITYAEGAQENQRRAGNRFFYIEVTLGSAEQAEEVVRKGRVCVGASKERRLVVEYERPGGGRAHTKVLVTHGGREKDMLSDLGIAHARGAGGPGGEGGRHEGPVGPDPARLAHRDDEARDAGPRPATDSHSRSRARASSGARHERDEVPLGVQLRSQATALRAHAKRTNAKPVTPNPSRTASRWRSSAGSPLFSSSPPSSPARQRCARSSQ